MGMFVNNGNDLVHWRILGTLQRLAITYFITAFIVIYVPVFIPEVLPSEDTITTGLLDSKKLGKRRFFKDLSPFWLQWIVVLGLLAVHTLLTFFLPVPGCPTGYLGPGIWWC
jgi:heparan-alpha-glucosaminide N-acetyltransferase